VKELMGNEIFLHCTVDGQPLLARVDARTNTMPGQQVDLALDMSRMYAFDPETQLSLTATQPGTAPAPATAPGSVG
jgi:multiple sugar transport system ATP-binding protein